MLDARFEQQSGQWYGEDANTVRYLIGRLSGLPKFPREVAGSRELALVLRNCESVDHAYAVVEEILQGWKECPVPASLREVIYAKRPQRKARRCQECHGERYISVPALVTYPHDHWPAAGMAPTRQERLKREDGGWATHDEAMELAAHLPGTQTIVSAAVPCGSCR